MPAIRSLGTSRNDLISSHTLLASFAGLDVVYFQHLVPIMVDHLDRNFAGVRSLEGAAPGSLELFPRFPVDLYPVRTVRSSLPSSRIAKESQAAQRREILRIVTQQAILALPE